MRTQVFISSRLKLRKTRKKAEEAVKSLELNAIRSENWGPRSAHTEAICRKEVRKCHIVTIILRKEVSRMVKAEYEEADTPPKKVIFVFLKKMKETKREADLREFLEEIKPKYTWKEYKNLNDLYNWIREAVLNFFEERSLDLPKGLEIKFDPSNLSLLDRFQYENSDLIRKFARVEIWNYGRILAKNVRGLLRVIEGPSIERYGPIKLHIAGTPEVPSTPFPVDIHPNDYVHLDIVFSKPERSEAPKILISPHATRTSSQAWIGRGTISPYNLNIDYAWEGRTDGCYIATNDALRHPRSFPQYHLPPENYVVEVEVSADNFEPTRKEFVIESPKEWEKLKMYERRRV